MNYYLVKTVYKDTSLLGLDELHSIALQKLNCSGIEEFSLVESEVDALLGERSYSGGNPPDNVLDEVEREMASDKQKSFLYFFDKENAFESALKWKTFLEDNSFVDLVSIEEKKYEDWNQSWRENFKSIEVAEDFHIIPSWEKEKTNLKGVFLYPGQGFGTGQHETTFLCLKLYYQIKNEKLETCLDFGCGSGILGLGAFYYDKNLVVDFYDIDEAAIENTVQNIGFNNWEDKKELSSTLELEAVNKGYDLVFANILAPTLIELKDEIAKRVNNTGFLILSGILVDQVDDVLEQYPNFKTVQIRKKNDWAAVLLKKTES